MIPASLFHLREADILIGDWPSFNSGARRNTIVLPLLQTNKLFCAVDQKNLSHKKFRYASLTPLSSSSFYSVGVRALAVLPLSQIQLAMKIHKQKYQIGNFPPFSDSHFVNWGCDLNLKILMNINLKKFAENFLS